MTRLASARLDALDFRHQTLAKLRRVVGFDGWCWSSVDPISGLPTGGAADNSPIRDEQRDLFELDYAPGGINDTAHPATRAPLRLLNAHTKKTPEQDLRRAEWLGHRGVGDQLLARLSLSGDVWGHIALYRDSRTHPFTDRDAAIMRPLLTLWAHRHQAEVARQLSSHTEQHDGRTSSAVFLLTGDDQLIASSPDVDQLLDVLPHPPGRLPLCVTGVAAWLAVRSDHHATPRMCVQGTDGQWRSIQAHRLHGSVPDGTIAVTVASAQPGELAALVMAAKGLTARERQVTTLVLAGLPTAEIAATLHIAAVHRAGPPSSRIHEDRRPRTQTTHGASTVVTQCEHHGWGRHGIPDIGRAGGPLRRPATRIGRDA